MSGSPRKTKVLLGWPWYDGPDIETYTSYNEVTHYFGRLQERSLWLSAFGDEGAEKVGRRLDPLCEDGDLAEITAEDGIFEFGYSDVGRNSLVGQAREKIVEAAIAWGADYLFMWDDDMKFKWSTFLRLWRHQKPVVNALGFTSTYPVWPCLWSVQRGNEHRSDWANIVFDYPKDQLISNEEVGGVIAFGAGVTLYDVNVFRRMPKPWFFSTGTGEDFLFCMRCHENGIRTYVDTSIKVEHLMKAPRWSSEEFYEEARVSDVAAYDKMKADHAYNKALWERAE